MRYFFILIFTLISVVGAHGQQGKIYGDLFFFYLPDEANISLSLGYKLDDQFGIGAQIGGILEGETSFSMLGLEAKWMKNNFGVALGAGSLLSYELTPEITSFETQKAFYPYARLSVSFRIMKVFNIGGMAYIHSPVNGNLYRLNNQTRAYDIFLEEKKINQERIGFQAFVGFSFPKTKK